MKDLKPFTSVAERKAAFANQPKVAREIASNIGAKVGGGFTQAQMQRRREAAANGKTYQPPRPKQHQGGVTISSPKRPR
jgi:hypothetical protein